MIRLYAQMGQQCIRVGRATTRMSAAIASAQRRYAKGEATVTEIRMTLPSGKEVHVNTVIDGEPVIPALSG